METVDAVVAGHICVDFTPAFAARKDLPLGEVLVPGKLTLMEGSRSLPGAR